MPISLRAPVRRLSQQEFGDVSFDVMRHVFAIHNELGRFFDERIYKTELAHRLANVQLEVAVDVSFGRFHKQYFIDVLASNGAVFEFKAVDKIGPSHRAQLLHYLLLTELRRGKLINVRPVHVEHEFVNTNLGLAERAAFALDTSRWNRKVAGAVPLEDLLTAVLRDWGTGLALALYEEAIMHFLGGPEQVEADVDVVIGGRRAGIQRVRLIAPSVALKLTALAERLDRFEDHARRLLANLDLRAIAWVNIGLKQLTFTVIER